MTSTERREKIVEIIDKRDFVSVKELSSIFNVSIMTINRDIKLLERNKLVRRMHGGVRAIKENIHEIQFSERLNAHIWEKENIAIKAVKFISRDDSIILDSSTTSIVLAKTISKNNLSGLTIITNSNYIINELKDLKDISIISTGGEYLNKFGCLTGLYTLSTLDKIRANKLFFSVGGVSIEEGLTDVDLSEIRVKCKMFEIVKEKILLVASHKFNKVLTHQVSPITIVDKIVTENIDKYLQDKLKSLEIVVEVVQ